jgi:hypothetical protein
MDVNGLTQLITEGDTRSGYHGRHRQLALRQAMSPRTLWPECIVSWDFIGLGFDITN